MNKRCAAWPPALVCLALPAQMPDDWTVEKRLGQDLPTGSTWYGAGLWAADHHGPAAPFTQSLGFGNSLVGSGLSLEAGSKFQHLDLAGEVMFYKDAEGFSHARLRQAHLSYLTSGGWYWGLEKEPLVWGYGLNGGYLLGEAAQPFPRFRIESPFKDLHIFSVPLGAWKGQFFLGRLEGQRILSEDMQDPSYRSTLMQTYSEPQGPMLSGFRAEARFGDSTEFYLNWINLFAGTVRGVSATEGYGLSDYLTALTGSKDTLAEGNNTPEDPTGTHSTTYKNKARSASNSDVGVRVRLECLEPLLGAKDVRFYVTRGSKAVNILYGTALHRPLYYLNKDIDRDWDYFRHLDLKGVWEQKYRYFAPSPEVPNDVIGVLLAWERWRLGLEYLDTVNSRTQFENTPTQQSGDPNGHRSFANAIYKAGFYYYGDPLGSGLGGEARYATVRLEWDPAPGWCLQTWIHSGDRPYRDRTQDWLLDHPGQTPGDNRFLGIQQILTRRTKAGLTVRAGYSYQHQNAVAQQEGIAGNGFRWFAEAAWRWSL